MANKTHSTSVGGDTPFAVASPFSWPAMQRWQDEITGFMTRRLEADQSTFQEMCECRDAATLLAVQQKWLTAAGEAYLQESQRLAELALEAVKDVEATSKN